MAEFIELTNVDSLKNGEMRSFSVSGKDILVARVEDKFFAVGNRCPHLNAELDKGKLAGTVLTCPKHGSQFDLTDGHVIRWTNFSNVVSSVSKIVRPPRGLITYPVKIEATRVMVEI
jgi:3-phenylpropionate/trans-cinnamate dioxygenase ferredoxin subunit